MLRFLSVRHLAIIDAVEIELEPGLTVLTGETGAGKSIIVEAIDLLLGGRASADLVRSGEAMAGVQAIFERPDGTETIVRREVSANGRSRGFIDGALATNAALQELGRTLLDLHGQHEHQRLLDPAEHARILDAHAGLEATAAAVGASYDAWRQAAAALDRTRLSDTEKRARLDLARFHLQQIDKIAPTAGEDDRLAAERVVLTNSDRLGRLSSEVFDLLHEREGAVLSSLAVIWRRLDDLAALDPRLAPCLEGKDVVTSHLDEIAFVLRDYTADLEASPGRLQAVEDRLAALELLKRRHGSLDEVLQRRQQLADEISALDASDEDMARLDKAAAAARQAFVEQAQDLSSRRREAARRLSAALVADLAHLAMPRSRVEVRFTELAESLWHRGGTEALEFHISPNPGEDLRPLARVASGGELSRIMLALRTIAGGHEPGRTLVFDEVDAGIGGEAAQAVAERLQALSATAQVLCVTHLPQIAARATTHVHVSKAIAGDRTTTGATALTGAEREHELARMIAGARVTPKVLASAREMLAQMTSGEIKTKGETAGPDDRAKAKGRRRA